LLSRRDRRRSMESDRRCFMPEAATTPAPTASSSPVDEMLYEVVDGHIMEKAPMGARQVWVASVLTTFMGSSVFANRIGWVVCEMLFVLDAAAKLKRRPDVAYVSYERWPQRIPVPPDDAWDVIPDLAIEINSPSNSGDEVQGKIKEYFRAGVRQVWVVYPITQLVYVYSTPTTVQILQPGDDLDGGTVLPGFRVAVSDLFVGAITED
jgi:Uma2 family endonuclease